MKNRTIEELHDRYIGHKKFAAIVDELIAQGYKVTEIKEYNEQFKFKVNNCEFIYRKEWKVSSKKFVKYLLNIYDMNKLLGELQNEKRD